MIGHLLGALSLAVVCGCLGEPPRGVPVSCLLADAAGWLATAPRTPNPEPRTPNPHPSGDARPAEIADPYHARTREAIQGVLAEREFANLHDDPYALLRLLLEWINSLFMRVATAVGRMPRWLWWLIVGWMLATLAAILAHLLYTLWVLLRSGAGPSGGGARRGHAGEFLGIRELEFDAVYAEARRLLGAGDWAAATRYLYVAAILWLDRQGEIVFRASKTNRDYLDELRGRDRLQNPLRRLTRLFEPIVYGGRPATGPTTGEMDAALQNLLQEAAGAVAG
jgi:hypothetical protein